jgi:hypothetical protein
MADLPLWRLVVALHDAEEVAGAASESARLIRQAIIDRLKGEPLPGPDEDREGPDA